MIKQQTRKHWRQDTPGDGRRDASVKGDIWMCRQLRGFRVWELGTEHSQLLRPPGSIHVFFHCAPETEGLANCHGKGPDVGGLAWLGQTESDFRGHEEWCPYSVPCMPLLHVSFSHGETKVSQVEIWLMVAHRVVKEDVVWLDVEVQNSVLV
jgi:hypothetical protein